MKEIALNEILIAGPFSGGNKKRCLGSTNISEKMLKLRFMGKGIGQKNVTIL